MAPSCLFVINGLGLGNSTRCHAVIEHLVMAGCEVHVLTSGNGLEYFERRPGITSLGSTKSFFYGRNQTGISGWSTLRTLPRLLRIAREKHVGLNKWLDRLAPDIAIVDSEYLIGPLRRRNIPIVAVNNSEVVVTEYLKHRHSARGTGSHFWFVEFADYLFHRRFCNLVLSPYPLVTPTRAENFQRIGMIVRPDVERRARENLNRPALSPRQVRTVVCMLSGSVHAAHFDFGDGNFPFAVEVVGRSGRSRGNVTFHGRKMDNVALLESADVFVINGGFSALSEALAFGKPTFVIPVPGHAEQFVNACLASDLGLGFVATEQDVFPQLLEMFRQDRWVGLAPRRNGLNFSGAGQAAAAILGLFHASVRKQTVAADAMIDREVLAGRCESSAKL